VDADIQNYTVAASAAAGVAFAGISSSTVAFSVTGGDGNDTINFGSHGAADQTLIGGAGDDTITIAGSTLTAADVIQGTSGSDTLILSGNTAIGVSGTNIAMTLVADIDTLTIQNTTTSVFLDTADGNVTAAGTMVVTTTQTTGSLTFNGVAELDGKFNITGGGGDDILTGGSGADTISGGAGSDTVTGGIGADVLNGNDNNDKLVGGLGSDTMTGGAGSDTFAMGAGAAATTVGGVTTFGTADQVWDFVVGAGGDKLLLDDGDVVDGGNALAASLTNSGGGGAAGNVVAAATATLGAATSGAVTDLSATAANIIVISGTSGTTFASALNGGSITVGANSLVYYVAYYDADMVVNGVAGAMVVSLVTNGADTSITGTETENIVMVVGMTAANYGAVVAGNIGFGG
jgi:Ca2+-binding RTX toxin-like protein